MPTNINGDTVLILNLPYNIMEVLFVAFYRFMLKIKKIMIKRSFNFVQKIFFCGLQNVVTDHQYLRLAIYENKVDLVI